ncbi:hypothetical protein QTP86_025059 [Hemibagrus guttatus]|nr:hypothetical protein QTP86_025059 [Hemibagrus guttatus]
MLMDRDTQRMDMREGRRRGAAFCSPPGPGKRKNLCPLRLLGIKAGYTLDGVPTHRRAHTHSHSLMQSHTTDNLEMPINLPCMSLDWRRKPEYPEETPEARGEHANSTHTWRRRESNPQPWRCEANVLTTKPPCPLSIRQVRGQMRRCLSFRVNKLHRDARWKKTAVKNPSLQLDEEKSESKMEVKEGTSGSGRGETGEER